MEKTFGHLEMEGTTCLGRAQRGAASRPLCGSWWERPLLALGPPARPWPSLHWAVVGRTPPGRPWRLPRQPPRGRSPRLSHHLKGHGKFNGDTHSCHGIQSRPCQKPSDCSGCLGLYTCKLPASTCDLKAVSRQRGGFLQSIQSPEGRRVLLIPEQHGSM
ncbi:uncharacterized protein LJ206_005546 [Theristicus caerulescens]